jgi:hypothetical protein
MTYLGKTLSWMSLKDLHASAEKTAHHSSSPNACPPGRNERMTQELIHTSPVAIMSSMSRNTTGLISSFTNERGQDE